LIRFETAHKDVYGAALQELRRGRKRTHWMWFIFPQFDGLGASEMSRRYAIRSLDEARAYLQHPVLGSRLQECAETILRFVGLSASDIFPFPDDTKLKSSITLFELAAPPGSVFTRVLDEYFRGERDELTLRLLKRSGGSPGGPRG
jgi:uncharacterized protein (DUF1810 family)